MKRLSKFRIHKVVMNDKIVFIVQELCEIKKFLRTKEEWISDGDYKSSDLGGYYQAHEYKNEQDARNRIDYLKTIRSQESCIIKVD